MNMSFKSLSMNHRTRQSAFTMVEIAIALAVIAFALVAILRILPLGMQVQRDNRQDTIINQDGTYLLEGIRFGARGVSDLRDYVDVITLNGTNLTLHHGYETGEDVIGLLTTPNADVRAIVRSISGMAATKGVGMRDFRMHYEVISQVRRVDDVQTTNNLMCIASNVPYTGPLVSNLYDIRLTLRWPLVPTNDVRRFRPSDVLNRQVFRTVAAGRLEAVVVTNSDNMVLTYFHLDTAAYLTP
jgi:hypothetical protein